MGNFFTKLFKRKKNKKRTIKNTDHSFIRVKPINYIEDMGMNNLILLIQFTEDYFYSALEFTAKCKDCTIELVNTSIPSGEQDKDGNDIHIQQHFIIISGNVINYANNYNHIPLSNEFLIAIEQIIYRYLNKEYFTTLIEDNVLFEKEFLNEDMKEFFNMKQDKITWYENSEFPIAYPCDIMNKLPKGIRTEYLLDILIYIMDGISYTLRGFIIHYNTRRSNYLYFITEFFDDTREDAYNIVSSPLYKLEIDYDSIHGELDDVEISDIFKEERDTFSAVYSEDNEFIEVNDEVDELIEVIDKGER